MISSVRKIRRLRSFKPAYHKKSFANNPGDLFHPVRAAGTEKVTAGANVDPNLKFVSL
jgi:hypothetical protein